jgi:beta-1,4-mannosyltransferase
MTLKSRPLVVGSWPGSGSEYARRFCESLAVNGIVVKDLKWPWECFSNRIDVLQIHWLEQALARAHPLIGFARAIFTVATIIVLRLRGVKLVWCVHNLEPHDARRHLLLFWRAYAGLVGYLVNGFITLSPSTVEIARAHFRGLAKKPGTFAWHPTYVISAPSSKGLTWRERHGVESSITVLAFIGSIRPYKGVEELIDTFESLSDLNLRLVIAGRVSRAELRALLEGKAAYDKRIILDLRWQTEQDLEEIVLASDVLVLPFKQILHSGSVIYGLSCGKAVVTPKTEYANDLRRQVGPQWIRTYEPPLSVAILSELCRPTNGEPNLSFLSIYESGAKLKEFYEALFDSQHG